MAKTTNPLATAPLFAYTPYLKDITGVTAGPSAGGKTITLSGLNLSSADAVAFGSASLGAPQGTTLGHSGDMKLTAVTPPGTGTVSIFVHGPGGWSLAPASGKLYSYAPVVTAASPITGSAGTKVTILQDGPRFLGKFDQDAVAEILAASRRIGIEARAGVSVKKMPR